VTTKSLRFSVAAIREGPAMLAGTIADDHNRRRPDAAAAIRRA
jgi:hypothetical protein